MALSNAGRGAAGTLLDGTGTGTGTDTGTGIGGGLVDGFDGRGPGPVGGRPLDEGGSAMGARW